MPIKKFNTSEEAHAALKGEIEAGRCNGGYVAEFFNVGKIVYTVHCRKGGSGWAL